MKVLQVNNCYKQGSTGKIVYDIHTELLAQGFESVVCYGRNGNTADAHVYKLCSDFYAKCNNLLSRFTGLMYGGCHLSTARLISIIKKEKPDVVHLHCLNGYFVNIYRLLSWLKQNRITTVLTLHAEFMHTGNCGHAFSCEKWKTGCGACPRLRAETKSLLLDRTADSWKKMKHAIEGFDTLTVTSVSPWLAERAMQSPILQGKPHSVVFNGLNAEVFHPTDVADLRAKYAKPQEKLVFHATPRFNNDPDHIKGGYYVLQLAEALREQGVKFVIAGPHEEGMAVPDNVTLLGRVTDQAHLAALYTAADATLLTSRRETFSMVVAESLCCGTPVVGFCAGAPERIALEKYSVFVPHGDCAALQQALLNMLAHEWDKAEIATAARETYDKRVMTNAYLDIYRSILSKND